jgi:hypothetical protein
VLVRERVLVARNLRRVVDTVPRLVDEAVSLDGEGQLVKVLERLEDVEVLRCADGLPLRGHLVVPFLVVGEDVVAAGDALQGHLYDLVVLKCVCHCCVGYGMWYQERTRCAGV